MVAILRQYGFFYMTHFFTFSMLIIAPMFAWDSRVYFVPMFLLPVWVTSSVLWSERQGSEQFLKTLPATNREIVRWKFSMLAGACAIYWILMFAFVSLARPEPGMIGVYVRFITYSAVSAFSLGLLAYVGIWFFGKNLMTTVIVLFMLTWTVFTITVISAVKSGHWRTLTDLPLVSMVAPLPWFVSLVFVALAAVAFWGFTEVGVRIRAQDGPWE